MSVTISGWLTRTELGLADLPLCDGLIDIDGEGPGEPGTTWRRQEAKSPFVDDLLLVGRVREQGNRAITFNVLGSTTAAVDAATVALQAALEQFSFELHVVIDGVERAWRCDSADHQTSLLGEDLRGYVRFVKAVIPTKTVPIVGPGSH